MEFEGYIDSSNETLRKKNHAYNIIVKIINIRPKTDQGSIIPTDHQKIMNFDDFSGIT